MKLSKDFHDGIARLNQAFKTDFAIISSVHEGIYSVVDVASRLDAIKQGDEFPVTETYCQQVMETGGIIHYSNVGKTGSKVMHPIYTALKLETYLGLPITYQGRVAGTLNFSGFQIRETDFSPEEIKMAISLRDEIEAAVIE